MDMSLGMSLANWYAWRLVIMIQCLLYRYRYQYWRRRMKWNKSIRSFKGNKYYHEIRYTKVLTAALEFSGRSSRPSVVSKLLLAFATTITKLLWLRTCWQLFHSAQDEPKLIWIVLVASSPYWLKESVSSATTSRYPHFQQKFTNWATPVFTGSVRINFWKVSWQIICFYNPSVSYN